MIRGVNWLQRTYWLSLVTSGLADTCVAQSVKERTSDLDVTGLRLQSPQTYTLGAVDQ